MNEKFMTPSDASILTVLVIGVFCISTSIFMMRLEHKWKREQNYDGSNNRWVANLPRHRVVQKEEPTIKQEETP